MQVRVLGPVQVTHGDQPVDLGTRKQRALLAALALHRGRPVSVDAIADLLWAESPPPDVGASLQSYVARLRRGLEPDRERRAPASVLVTVGAAYALHVPADSLDAARFDRVVAEEHRRLAPLVDRSPVPDPAALPREQVGEAAARLDAALDLWRGTPYAELEEADAAVAERARLAELHLVATEDRAVAHLVLGHHGTVAAELEALTAAHPLRERLWALRALALTRSGRQADALDVLRQVREVLADELGLEPGAELRDLQTAVLRQDPALAWVPPVAAARTPAGTPAGPPDGGRPRDAPRPTRRAPAGWPMVGRDDDLAGLLGLLETAQAGTPAFAAVCGDPGIGKTRLASELAAEAEQRGVTVLTGRCSQDEGAPPLWPWAAVLRGLGEELPTVETADEDEGAQFRTWEAVAAAVVAAAQDRAVLVFLDDLHWADTPTLRVLRLLAETRETARLLVLSTWRTHPEPTGALADVAETLARRHALRVTLTGLGAEQAAQVVGTVGRERPSAAEAEALRARTDGNPFFLVEYARLAAERGDLGRLLAESRPPEGVRDVLVRRLERLPAPTLAVLRPAAVLGRRFDAVTLAAVSGSDEDALLDLLEPALAAGLVREDGIDEYAFAHALVRDAIYAGLAASRRARMHARVAEALAESPGRETERARHWLAAGPAAAARAWPAAVAAAAVTRRLHAHAESAELLTSALASMTDDPAAGPRERYPVLMQLADAYRWTGQLPDLVEVVERAIDVAEQIGEVELVAAAASATTLGLFQSADHGEVHEGVVGALRRCLARLPTGDSPVRCRTMLSLANELYFGATFQERQALVDEALAMARRIGDTALLVDALLVAHIALFTARTAEQRLAYTTEAMELAAASGQERAYVIAATLRAVVEGELGLVEPMTQTAATAHREAERLRHQYALVILEALMVPWLAMAGRFEECDERIARMHHLMELMGGAGGDDDVLTQLSLGLWRGRSAEVAPQIAAMDGGPLPFSATVVACLLRGGADDEARAYAAEHPIDVRGHDNWLSMLPWCHAAEAALGLGDRPLAAQAYATLAPYAGHSSSAGAHNAMGPVDAFLALAAATVGEKDLAARHAERALELMQQWQLPLAADWLRGLRERYGF